jgi:ankyrin repeat protein
MKRLFGQILRQQCRTSTAPGAACLALHKPVCFPAVRSLRQHRQLHVITNRSALSIRPLRLLCSPFTTSSEGTAAAKSELEWDELVRSVMTGDTELVKDLLGAGVNANNLADNQDAWTPLMHAAMGGHMGCVEALISAGANTNAKDWDGWTALMHASMAGQADIMKVLITAGADINSTSRIGGTALMSAASMGLIDCLQLLVDAGADINIVDIDGLDALDYAIDEGNEPCCDILEGNGERNDNWQEKEDQDMGRRQTERGGREMRREPRGR